MSTPDPLFDPLRQLSVQSAPDDPATLRQLGERRRVRRRQTLGAVAVVVVLATGAGTLVSQLDQSAVPAPVAPSPTASATPAPSPVPTPAAGVTEQHVVRAMDLRDSASGMTWDDDVPPGQDEAPSSCQRAPWSELGATSEAVGWMERGEGAISTSTAVQFPDAQTAGRAMETVRQWVEDCPAYLRGEGAAVRPEEMTWYPVQTEVGTAQFATAVAYLPDGKPEDGPWVWETVGIVQVDARLGITVDRESTTEYYYHYSPDPDPETGQPPNPQYPLLAAAALRLADRVPEPGPSGSETAVPGQLGREQVPQAEDFVWTEGVEISYTELDDDESARGGRCQRAETAGSLGASDVAAGTLGSDVADGTSIAMGFPDTATADAAWATLLERADSCGSHLEEDQEFTLLIDPEEFTVPVEQGEAVYHRFLVEGEGGDAVTFDWGLTRVEDRIVVVEYQARGIHANFDSAEGGNNGITWPMIRTLQNLNQRLAG